MIPEGSMMYAAMAIRLLLLTSCRKSEILGLHWEHVNLEARELRLPDGKTGLQRMRLHDCRHSFASR